MAHRNFFDPRTAWSDLSRARRKAGSMRIKNKIREQAPWLGGLFATDDFLHGASMADAWLVSKRGPRLYNATLRSAMSAYFQRCNELATQASLARLPLFDFLDDLDSDDDPELEELGLSGLNLRPWPEPSPAQIQAELDAFGGQTRDAWVRQESARLADSGDVWVLAGSRQERHYDFGVGLVATLPCDLLGVEEVHEFARDFRERGEPEAFDLATKFSYPNSRRASLPAPAPPMALQDWAPRFNAASARQERQAIELALAPAYPSTGRRGAL